METLINTSPYVVSTIFHISNDTVGIVFRVRGKCRMDFQTIKEYFSPENMDHIVESYKAFGPLWYWFTDDRGVDSSITAYRICTGELLHLAFGSVFFIHGLDQYGCITCLFIIRHFGRSRFRL